VKKWGLVPGVGTGPPTGLRQWTRQHFARTRRGCLPSFYRVLSQRELTSVASCAASEKVVIFHQPTFPFTRFPTATYPHRPQARKGPFLFSDDSHHLPHSRSQSHGQAQIPNWRPFAVKQLLSQIRPALRQPAHARPSRHLSAGAIRRVVIIGIERTPGLEVTRG